MATADHITQAGTVSHEPSRGTWFVAAIVILVVLAVVFGALWLVERSDVAALETDLTTAEQTVQELEASLLSADTEVASLQAEVAALNSAGPVPHEFQAEIQSLYDDFLVAIQEPKAEQIAAMFTPAAIHINASGQQGVGAKSIGEGWESYGALTVSDPGELIVNGNLPGSMVAAMTGTVRGVEGLLVTRIVMTEDGPLFSYMLWHGS